MKLFKEFYVLLSPILWALLLVLLALFGSIWNTMPLSTIVLPLLAMFLLGIPLLFSRDESKRKVLNKVRIGVAGLLYLGEAVFFFLGSAS
jgi:hypothetical protein